MAADREGIPEVKCKMDRIARARGEMNMNCKHTERNVSLDLLRVLCMFLIVLGHVLFHGKVLDALPANSANYFIISILRTVLSVHVNCFVLISGYFLCMREFQLKRAILIWGQAFFWSIGLYIVLYFCGAVDLDLKSLIKACFPITQQRYWFITTYVLMYSLVPLLNAAIRAMSQKTHAIFLSGFFAMYIALQNLVFWEKFSSTNSYDPLFFAFLYLFAAYFRLYPAKRTHIMYLWGYLLACLFAAAWKIGITWIMLKTMGEVRGDNLFLSYNSITMVIGSACLFRFFEGLNITDGKLQGAILRLSPLTLGIYLIHEQPEVRRFIWQDLLRPMDFVNSPFLVLIVIGMAVAVFLVCAMIEYLRHKAFEILKIREIVTNLADKIQNAALTAIEKVFRL